MTIASRRVAAVATDAACRALGRRAVIRAARYFLLHARLADLETFVAGNYVACDPAIARRLPVVPWWKELSG
jgi:hypothetical protein